MLRSNRIAMDAMRIKYDQNIKSDQIKSNTGIKLRAFGRTNFYAQKLVAQEE